MAETQPLVLVKPDAQSKNPVRIDDLHARLTDELVIAVVGPVGSGCTTISKILGTELKTKYKYDEVVYHKISDIIVSSAGLVNKSYDSALKQAARVRALQDLGNGLRARLGHDYLAAKIVEKIASHRLNKGGFTDSAAGTLIPEPRRWAHIVDSLKNPAELALLRDVYGDMLWVVGVFAPEEIRRDRLTRLQDWEESEMAQLLERDLKQELDSEQGVRDTFFKADFFVRNDGENDDNLTLSVKRHLEVMFGHPVRTPSSDESAMYAAYAAASRSACLSRQVGAAIVAKAGELIGIGWNDVPRFGGGVYESEDAAADHRCYKWAGKICHNDHHKQRLLREIAEELKAAKLVPVTVPDADIETALRRTSLRQLIEFSRSVHAEMVALIDVARGNKPGLVGSTLYCTTFPCHSCARHLVAAGVARVVYIEPYPKSLAGTLHKDSTSVLEGDSAGKMVMVQYEGFSPPNLLRLFKAPQLVRKIDGRLIDFDPTTAHPLGARSVDDFSTSEKRVLSRLLRIEQHPVPVES